jgi:hypothetical protein
MDRSREVGTIRCKFKGFRLSIAYFCYNSRYASVLSAGKLDFYKFDFSDKTVGFVKALRARDLVKRSSLTNP